MLRQTGQPRVRDAVQLMEVQQRQPWVLRQAGKAHVRDVVQLTERQRRKSIYLHQLLETGVTDR